jgi:plasmid maintenance system antidote protein VapI
VAGVTVEACPHCGGAIQAAERQVRDAIRQALFESDTTQSQLAATVGVTQKHISQVLSGKAGLSFDFAEKLLAALGRRLEVSVVEIAAAEGIPE